MAKMQSGALAKRVVGASRFKALLAGIFVAITAVFLLSPDDAAAQNYRFNSVSIEGNQRVESGTILTYAGIARGDTISAGELNQAYRRILDSGLFEEVELEPRGGTLVIRVVEYPTVNRISFEGNRRLDDDALEGLIQSQPRLVFNAAQAERDAAAITEAYSAQGRLAAKVTPRVIRRSDNRVDLVFEIFEGGTVEVERISFVGNTQYSDRRLRRVLETKQAGFLRTFIRSDTYIEDRIEFDKQVLSDFYQSRGYVDFRTTSVSAELTQERDGFFITFNVEEGQQFRFGEVTTSSDLPDVDPDDFLEAVKVKPGGVYSPTRVEDTIARLERLSLRKNLNFVRVDPRITRNDRDLTLDVEFALVRGQRLFVERIDIEGNATTLDRVIRRQFRIVEGDPFNPREIRESAERIRALGYFTTADVNAREGSAPDQVVVDVDVEEAPTGSLSLGGNYSTAAGFGVAIAFSETNLLGRGQFLDLALSTAEASQVYSLSFGEPAFLGRDLRFDIDLTYRETDNEFADYDTNIGVVQPSFRFPVSENGRLQLRYTAEYSDIVGLSPDVGQLITDESAIGGRWASSLGYTYSFDTRRSGLNPNAGILLQFGQDFAGVGGDVSYIKTQARAAAQTRVWNEEVILRASLDAGAINFTDGVGRVTDRYLPSVTTIRGFEPDGIGPREYNGAGVNDALGGNFFAVARFEAEFPLGLPEEYGIRGGLFYDVGSLWGLDRTNGDVLYEDFSLRQVVGISIFWDTPVGPLRFNFSEAFDKRRFDEAQVFDLQISAEF